MNPAAFLVPIVVAGSHLFLASADAGTTTTAPVALGTEAWFSSPQLCLIPGVCLPIASPLPATYPAGTLHIASSGGNESARTYLSLRRPLQRGSMVTGGVLRLPLDTSPLDGSVAPDLAKIEACTTRVPITRVEGSTAKPPAVDCASAPISHVIGTPASELDIDLKPIAKRLSEAGTSLALLPVTSLGATWNVTLSSDKRPKGSATTPVLLLTTADRATPPDTTPEATAATRAGSAPAGVQPPVGVPSLPVAPPEASALPDTGNTAPVIAPRALALPSGAHGFDYPAVFLVPLLILAGLLGFGRQLTRPLHRTDRN